MLDTKQVAEILNVQYYDIDNLVRVGILTPITPGRGKPREFGLFDLVSAKVALLLRMDGHKTTRIKELIKLIKNNWHPGDKYGGIGTKDYEWDWIPSQIIKRDANGDETIVNYIPFTWYGVANIANELTLKINKNDA